MMATRPANVPADATCIQPGEMYAPGLGLQQLTLISIDAQITKQNSDKKLFYSNGLRDWLYNAQWASYSHQPPPQPPQKPQIAVFNVVYADLSGTVVEPPDGANGLHYAWAWQTYE